MFEVNNKDTRGRHWRRSGVLIVKFKHISYLVIMFPIVNFEHVSAGWEQVL